jgi:hypothetical protein
VDKVQIKCSKPEAGYFQRTLVLGIKMVLNHARDEQSRRGHEYVAGKVSRIGKSVVQGLSRVQTPKQQTTRRTHESNCDRQRDTNRALEPEMSSTDMEGYELGTQ